MNILLCTPLYSQHFDAGHFWLKALNELGQSVIVWDYRLDSTARSIDQINVPDATLVLKGEGINPNALPRPRFCYWPDAFFRDPGIEERLRLYDKVFTPVRPMPDWMEWLPTSFDEDIHRNLQIPRTVKTIYIGTNNSDYKREMVMSLYLSAVHGNGWGQFKDNVVGPVYLHDFVKAANQAKILIDIHHDPRYGLNRKFFEMIACGFTLVDRVPGAADILGPDLADRVTFTTTEEARKLIAYYLIHPEERESLWSQQRKAIQPYSYLKAAKKILRYLK